MHFTKCFFPNLCETNLFTFFFFFFIALCGLSLTDIEYELWTGWFIQERFLVWRREFSHKKHVCIPLNIWLFAIRWPLTPSKIHFIWPDNTQLVFGQFIYDETYARVCLSDICPWLVIIHVHMAMSLSK